jgi:phage shock protein A
MSRRCLKTCKDVCEPKDPDIKLLKTQMKQTTDKIDALEKSITTLTQTLTETRNQLQILRSSTQTSFL